MVNIALNKRLMKKIYPDLKRIHKIAIKNDKIDFKTKVDLFVEISKFIEQVTRSTNQGKKDDRSSEFGFGSSTGAGFGGESSASGVL